MKKIEKILGQEIEIPKHIQLWNNPSITIQDATICWEQWKTAGIQTLEDMTNHDLICTYKDLKEKYKIEDTEIFRYLQLTNWMRNNIDCGYGGPTEIGKILKRKDDKKIGLTGRIYNILMTADSSDTLLQNIYNKWTIDLNIDAGIRWKECLHLTNKITTNENLRLIQYKLMTRIYYSRDKINKFDSTSSNKCLKCKTESDSLIHAFWYCEKIRESWKEIEEWLSTICKSRIAFTPQTCLFQNTINLKYPTGWQITFSSLIYKKLILQNWKNEDAPSVDRWKRRMKYYLNLERNMSENSSKKRQFEQVWEKIFEAL